MPIKKWGCSPVGETRPSMYVAEGPAANTKTPKVNHEEAQTWLYSKWMVCACKQSCYEL